MAPLMSKRLSCFVNLDDLEILNGSADLAHVARHAHAAHDSAGKQALTDCAGPPVPAFGAVGTCHRQRNDGV